MSTRYRHNIVNIAMSTMLTMSTRYDKVLMSTQYRHDIVNIAMSTMWTMYTRYDRPPMTGYRCWHDIDTISSTSLCRRCKRGMTRYRCWHDIDTISSTSRCRWYRKNIVNWTYDTYMWTYTSPIFINVHIIHQYYLRFDDLRRRMYMLYMYNLDWNNIIKVELKITKARYELLKLYYRYEYTRPYMINRIWSLKQLWMVMLDFIYMFICFQRDSNLHHASPRLESQRLRPLGRAG